MSWLMKPSFCTFIVPTLGRPSLKTAIQSLLDQTSWNWRGMIIFDGVDPIEIKGLNPAINYLEDNHFIVIKTEKKSHAGLVRNVGLGLVDTTWTCFLDDDDFLKKTYVDKLKEYSTKNPKLDIIIFTYEDKKTRNIQPPQKLNHIKECNVGISFAVKTQFVQHNEIEFTPFSVEDFRFLDACVKKGATYLITHDTQYYVNGKSGWL